MKMVRDFEKGMERVGHQSLAKEASKYTKEYCLQLLKLQYPDLACVTEEGEVVPREKL